jgi:hypothetical protein
MIILSTIWHGNSSEPSDICRTRVPATVRSLDKVCGFGRDQDSMKPKRRFLMTLAATGLCTLGGVWGGTDQTKPIQCKRGLLGQVDLTQGTLRIAKRSGKPTGTFTWNADTLFLDHGLNVSAKELESGRHATVYYQPQNGQQVATEVIVHGTGLSQVQWDING